MQFGKYTFNSSDAWKTIEWAGVAGLAAFLGYLGENVAGVDSVWGPLIATAAVAASKFLQRLLTPSPVPIVPTPSPVPSDGKLPNPGEKQGPNRWSNV